MSNVSSLAGHHPWYIASSTATSSSVLGDAPLYCAGAASSAARQIWRLLSGQCSRAHPGADTRTYTHQIIPRLYTSLVSRLLPGAVPGASKPSKLLLQYSVWLLLRVDGHGGS
eukprot:scaffold7458_cov61-Phaeocystis_antarctica.AAC.4